MTTLHVVACQVGGFAREDDPRTQVVGAYSNQAVAEAVKKVAGWGATVTAVEVDHIPAGLLNTMKELGIKLPESVAS